jgi:hypothetical protein
MLLLPLPTRSLSISVYCSVSISVYCSLSISVYRSLSVYICLLLSFCVYLFIALFLSLFIALFLSLFIALFLSLFTSIFLSLFIVLFLSQFIALFLCISVYCSLSVSVYCSLEALAVPLFYARIFASISKTRVQGDQFGFIFVQWAIAKNITQITQVLQIFWLLLFQDVLVIFIFAKKRAGLHFGPFFHKTRLVTLDKTDFQLEPGLGRIRERLSNRKCSEPLFA